MSTEQLISCIALGIALTAFIISGVTAIYVFAYLRKRITQGIQGPPGPPGPMGRPGECKEKQPAASTPVEITQEEAPLTSTDRLTSDAVRTRKRNALGQ